MCLIIYDINMRRPIGCAIYGNSDLLVVRYIENWHHPNNRRYNIVIINIQ